MQGSVSQTLYLCPSSNFMTNLAFFFIKDFLHLIKSKLGNNSETRFLASILYVHVLKISFFLLKNEEDKFTERIIVKNVFFVFASSP